MADGQILTYGLTIILPLYRAKTQTTTELGLSFLVESKFPPVHKHILAGILIVHNRIRRYSQAADRDTRAGASDGSFSCQRVSSKSFCFV